MAQWQVTDPQRIEVDGEVGRLEVSLVRGRVSVLGAPGPARIEISQVGRRPLHVEHVNGRLRIHHGAKRLPAVLWWVFSRRYRCDVTVAVPPETPADVTVVEGRAAVAGLLTKTDVDVTSGRVSLLGLAGTTRAKLVSGPVEAIGIAGDLTVESVSGDLAVAQSGADRVRATTVSGTITCDVDSSAPTEIRLSTVSGEIAVRVPADSDLVVDLTAASGSITTAFALDASGRPWSSRVRGRLGAGTGSLRADTTSGRIALLASE
ncbi:MAG: DUF4097 family beta strand repeat protein [Streptomycetaceae bacterium]|nr:DUF4097 family beta strand repeat protein [Streptomycetaceae bacterium]